MNNNVLLHTFWQCQS